MRIKPKKNYLKAINDNMERADDYQLIQTTPAIFYSDYLYLSQLLVNCIDQKEREEMLSLIRNGSVITWRHINLHGEFDFRRNAANDPFFDIEKILLLSNF